MSKKGTSTFVLQRATAVLLIPLTIWFLVSVIAHAGDSFAGMSAWLSQPLTSGIFALLVSVGAIHMRIGMSEIIVDYIDAGLRGALLLLNWLVAISVIAIAIWSAYQLSFAG